VSSNLIQTPLKPPKSLNIKELQLYVSYSDKSLFAACKKDIPEIQLTVNVNKSVGGSLGLLLELMQWDPL
jgi:hypothetical protein